ncbi:hypothetical protein ALC56_05559 [Trachymyrmex septentrionalis]|uniref:Double jelly roll-like domain-containing protein n=1 Tax=Trachymyrmex septentrionalis TaxID=34720 RepID=A0A151JXN4_9HYME|nr:hypothetical protein ALC56_05559 [Trachymyrmex septentrionalis]
MENPVMEPEIELFKVQWRMPHVALNDINAVSIGKSLSEHEFLLVGSVRVSSVIEYDQAFIQRTPTILFFRGDLEFIEIKRQL